MKKNKTYKLNTPVLYMVFNRLDTVKKTFQEIKKVKPKKLFIAADGPRTPEEKKKTDEVRAFILKNINWKCKVNTLFRDKNLGCKYAVSSAIDWFFNNVEYGIILEDDCLPSQSFFRFCQEMLIKYKDNERIMHISGTNVEERSDIKESYFFSQTFNVWGWATWRRAWKFYDVEMKDWKKINQKEYLKSFDYNIIGRIRSKRIYDLTYRGKLNTWDYQWDFICNLKKGICVVPKLNLITNLGFEEGTHTTNYDKKAKTLKRYQLEFPLVMPDKIIIKNDYFKSYITFYKFSLKDMLKSIPKKMKSSIKKVKNNFTQHL
jgi:hypothetical protein